MKKGFTLIELLAVIVILAVIALIATPIVMDIINDSRDGAFDSNVISMEKSAGTYLAANPELVPGGDGEYIEVTLDTLIADGYIKTISSPYNGAVCDLIESKVKITRFNDEFYYQPYLECDDVSSDNPLISLNGGTFEQTVGENYIEDGYVTAVNENVTVVVDYGTYDKDIPGTYAITYTATDDNSNTETAIREVYVWSTWSDIEPTGGIATDEQIGYRYRSYDAYAYFNGTDAYGRINNTSLSSTGRTYIFNMDCTGTYSWGRILSMANNSGTFHKPDLAVSSTGVYGYNNSDLATGWSTSTAHLLNDGKVELAYFEGSSGNIKVYLNGILITDRDHTSNTMVSDGSIVVASRFDLNAEKTQVKMYDLEIWNRELSGNEVANHYTNGNVANTSDLYMDYNFDEYSGDIITDNTGNTSMTVTNTTLDIDNYSVWSDWQLADINMNQEIEIEIESKTIYRYR